MTFVTGVSDLFHERLYVIIVLLLCCIHSTTPVCGQQWVSASAQSKTHISITSSGNINTKKEVIIDIPGYYLVEKSFEGKNLKVLQIPEGQPILETGCPDLERYSFTLQVPASGNMVVSISSESYTDYTGIDIMPSAGNVMRNQSNDDLKKGEIYTTDSFYPGKLVEADQPYIVRNTRAQSYHVYPLQYNPVTRILRFYNHLTVNLIYTSGIGVNPLNSIDLTIKPIEGIHAVTTAAGISALKEGTLPDNRGSLLIICPEKFRNAVLPLAEWRIQTGIPTEIMNSEQFTDPQSLYDYIKTYYYSHSNLAYLLLVGNTDYVPHYIFPYGVSDNYYSYLAGDDHYPDILVGRFSAESVKDVEVQVQRTLQYEKNPGTDATWITNAIGIGSTNIYGDDGESDFVHVRNLLKAINTRNQFTTFEFFDGSQGGSDAAGDPSASEITEKIDKGSGIIFYCGHGSAYTLATGNINNSVISGLDNNGKYPLIWAAACQAGNDTKKNCLAETWLRATNSAGQPVGAVAAVMSSADQAINPPMQAQDKIAEILGNPQETMSTMGAVSIKGMMSMNDKYSSAGFKTTDTWILFGDPSLRIRTSIPKQLIVDHKGTIGSGRLVYTIKCNAAEGFVCISYKGEILGSAALANGMATILLDRPASGENLILTTTALNYLPSVETIQVVNIPGEIEFSSPLNHSKNQPINSYLSWECSDGGTADYYLLYLGTDNPPTNLINGQRVNSNSFKPQFNFKYTNTYYWKVIPVNNHGNGKALVMDFETVLMPDEDFESIKISSIVRDSVGGKKWYVDGSQYFDGKHAARSGLIHDNENSSLIYPCDVKTCDFVSFWSKTSSEQGDKLSFIVDGSTLGEWNGQTDWSFHIYKVDSGPHLLEWRYAKDNTGSAGSDAAWVDDINLPVHMPALAKVPESGSVCEASGFSTSASVQNYFSVKWSTKGYGTFDDSNLANTTYTPGSSETLDGKTTLQLQINSFDGCPVISKSLLLTINPLPVIKLPADTIITKGSTVELDATITGNNTYIWNPAGSTRAMAIIDSASSVNGKRNSNVTITNEFGCSASKDVVAYFNNSSIPDEYTVFPNPTHGDFTLNPTKGSVVVDAMKLVDKEGKIVWTNEGPLTIFGSKGFSIPGLSAGAYILVNENKNGRSVNPVIIY